MAAKSTKSKTTGKKTNTTAKKPSSNKKTTRKTTKRTTGKRKTAGRKSTGNGNSFLIDEILIWTTLAVSIILLISNFGIAGFLGDAISGFLWNVFGVAAYVIPFILFGLVSFLISNKDNRNAYVKSLIGVILLILAEVLLHLIDDMGGKIGKSVASVLTPAIGVAGTYVITIIFMIICLVIITGKSALRGVKAGSDKAYARAREDARRHKELAEELAGKGYQFSSANSINIGRLVPQVVYYVYAYAKLLENEELANGEELQVVVPTGNFGNILAAYYAKQMGVPIGKLICASNENKVLFDFFQTGTYDKNREFVLTTSPSMDILISSNLERLIYVIAGEDSDKTKELMEALKKDGTYTVSEDMKAKLSDFAAGYATEDETAEQIHDVYDKTGYVMDTHTAVASYVCSRYEQSEKTGKKYLIASTASPYKFVKSVMTAIDAKYAEEDEFALLPKLQELSQVGMPQAIKDILDANVLHNIECDVDQMEETVKQILNR